MSIFDPSTTDLSKVGITGDCFSYPVEPSSVEKSFTSVDSIVNPINSEASSPVIDPLSPEEVLAMRVDAVSIPAVVFLSQSMEREGPPNAEPSSEESDPTDYCSYFFSFLAECAGDCSKAALIQVSKLFANDSNEEPSSETGNITPEIPFGESLSSLGPIKTESALSWQLKIPTNLSESSKASYNILERLAKIEYVIEKAEDAPFELQVSKSESRRKEFPSRIINLDPTTLLSSDTTLTEKIKQYVDPELVSYCKNPWEFLKEKFDINETTQESQLNKLARLAFEDKSFVPINYKVLSHPEIKEYVVKTNSSQVSYIQTEQGTAGNNNGDHLLRFIMSKRILELESKYGLQVTSPKIHIIDSKVETENPYDRYLVVQERITTLSSRELEQSILDMPKEKQEQLAKDLCFLIVHLGFIDCHLGNITLLDNGKLCIFDEEPMGALVCSGDISPNYDLGIDECGSIGLQRLIDSSENLPIFQKIATECLTELKEVGIDSISSRRAFHSFICCITDSLSSKEAKAIAFKKLDPRLKKFFSKIVSLMYQNPSINGSTQILEHPEILQNICSASGLNVLRQFKVRFELQEGIEILTGLKNALLTPETTEKDITILVQKLAELFDGRVLFDPIYKKIKRILENIQQKHTGANAQEKLKELTLKLLNTRITGSTQCLLDDLIGMLKETKKDLSLERMTWNVTKALDSRYGSVILSPTPAQHLGKEQMLATRFPELDLSKKLNVLIVAYECSMFGLKFGGLGEAIYGMAKGLSDNGHKVTLLLPKFDKLPESLQQEMELSGELKHPYKGATKKDNLYRLERNGLSIKYIEDTRESEDEPNHFELLSAQRIYEDGVLADPEQPWLGLKHRMAYFSNAASEYIMNNAEEVDAVMYNDWHAAYAATLIKERYFTKWSQGKTPASVFIIHNNNYGCQGVFEGKDATLLPLFGDQRLGMNSMLDGIENSDEIVTVSKTFAEEMQKPYLGFGIDPWMRQTAHKGKLSGIVNGSNPDLWDPSKNSTLKNWVDPETNQRLDLTFSAQDADILEKKQQIKQQLQKALLKYYPAEVEEFRLDLANNDFILYVGRYDSTQKGTEKFKIFLEKASALGLGFVTMGVGEDEEATTHLDELEALAKVHENSWITRGDKSEFSITMQRGNAAKGIPGLGPLLRAAAFMTIAPSKFEPCGLVQLESWLFGTPIIACATGGLADTVISDTISDEFNGFTFARLEEWDSEAQNSLISATIDQAVFFWAQVPSERKTQLMQNMMKSAQLSSWTSSAKGITPIQEYERVLLAAMEKRSIRGTKPVDLISVDEIASPSRDHYFGSGLQCQLYKEFGAHIIKNEARDAGVRFKTMAPGATFVSVVIKNGIVEKTYPMQSIGDGSWQVEIQDARKGTVYMYELTDSKGNVRRKVDPFAFESHEKTDVGSVVTDIENFTWTDESWMVKRGLATERPVNIYEIHLSSFGKNTDGTFKSYREIAHDLAEWAGYLGYTHIEILGLLEHPADCSWGYQVSGYFSPTKRHGNFEDFQYFINHLHENNIGIIVDFVPYHFAPDEWSLREFGGQKFFESAHPYNGESPEWGTRVFAVEREDVRNFLLSSAHFLLENHIDGLRVDAVSMLTSHKLYSKLHRKSELNEQNTHENLHGETFLRSLTTMAHEKFANIITHSENSRSKPLTKVDTDPVEQGGYGFDGRWNFNFLHSSLELLGASSHASSRHYLRKIISSFGYEQGFQNILAISHDEVSYHKQSLYQKAQSDDHTIKMSKVRINKTLQMLAPGRGVLTFMGCEFGTKEKWDYRKPFNRSEISDEQHLGTLNLSRDLNAFYISNKAFWNAGSNNSRFHLLAHHANNLIFSHRRWDEEGNRFTIIHNFSDKSYDEYYFKGSKDVLPLPISNLEIVFDSDKVTYGGSGIYQHQKNPILESPNSKGIRKFKVQLAAFTTLVLKDVQK